MRNSHSGIPGQRLEGPVWPKLRKQYEEKLAGIWVPPSEGAECVCVSTCRLLRVLHFWREVCWEVSVQQSLFFSHSAFWILLGPGKVFREHAFPFSECEVLGWSGGWLRGKGTAPCDYFLTWLQQRSGVDRRPGRRLPLITARARRLASCLVSTAWRGPPSVLSRFTWETGGSAAPREAPAPGPSRQGAVNFSRHFQASLPSWAHASTKELKSLGSAWLRGRVPLLLARTVVMQKLCAQGWVSRSAEERTRDARRVGPTGDLSLPFSWWGDPANTTSKPSSERLRTEKQDSSPRCRQDEQLVRGRKPSASFRRHQGYFKTWVWTWRFAAVPARVPQGLHLIKHLPCSMSILALTAFPY